MSFGHSIDSISMPISPHGYIRSDATTASTTIEVEDANARR